MMTTIHKTMLGLGLLSALLLGGCDKGADKDKSADKTADKAKDEAPAKTDDKADDKAGHMAGHEGMHEGMHEGGGDEGKPAEVAEVEAGGRVEITVDGGGYHPAEIKAPPNSKVTLAFTRPDEKNCGGKLVIAAMELEKDLPVGESVEIEVEVPESGELGFACGMNMYKGKVVPKS